jgi:hypothetical protein
MEATALLAGVFFKGADDLLDTHHPLLVKYSEHIKTLCIVFTTLFFFLNPEHSIFFLLIIPVCFFVKQIDTDFWKSMIPIPLITLALTYHTIEYKGLTDSLEKILSVLSVSLVIILEDKAFPEESSQKKSIFRATVVVLGILALYATRFFKSPDFYRAGIYVFYIGYYATSVLLMNTLELPSGSMAMKDVEVVP